MLHSVEVGKSGSGTLSPITGVADFQTVYIVPFYLHDHMDLIRIVTKMVDNFTTWQMGLALYRLENPYDSPNLRSSLYSDVVDALQVPLRWGLVNAWPASSSAVNTTIVVKDLDIIRRLMPGGYGVGFQGDSTGIEFDGVVPAGDNFQAAFRGTHRATRTVDDFPEVVDTAKDVAGLRGAPHFVLRSKQGLRYNPLFFEVAL